MQEMSIMGVFCEDIRDEIGGAITLVGIIPDNIGVEPSDDKSEPEPSQHPRVLMKLCVYVRANFDPDDSVNEIKLRLLLPGGEPLDIGGAKTDILQSAKHQAKQKGNPIAGVNLRAVLAPFPFPRSGILRLEAEIDTERRILGALNFAPAKRATSSNEP